MLLTTCGLVLRETAYKEFDKMLTVLTPDEGKLSVKARGGARGGTMAGVQLFCFSEMTLFGNRGRWTINEAEAQEQFLGLRDDITKLALAAYFAELLEAVSDEERPSAALLQLGLNSLFALSRGLYEPEHIKAAFELRLICLAGYEPQLSSCVICGGQAGNPTFFSCGAGGLCCGVCAGRGRGAFERLDDACLSALRHIVSSGAKKLFSFALEAGRREELGRIAEIYLMTQLERGFSTLDYWKRLRGAEKGN